MEPCSSNNGDILPHKKGREHTIASYFTRLSKDDCCHGQQMKSLIRKFLGACPSKPPLGGTAGATGPGGDGLVAPPSILPRYVCRLQKWEF